MAELSEALTQAVLAFMARSARDLRSVPRETRALAVPHQSSTGLSSGDSVSVPLVTPAVLSLLSRVHEWSEFDAVRNVASDPSIRASIGSRSTPWWGRLLYALVNLMDDFLARVWLTPDLWEEAVAVEFAGRFSRSLTTGNRHAHLLSELKGCSFPNYAGPVRITDNCVLRTLSDAEWLEYQRKRLTASVGTMVVDLPYLFLDVEPDKWPFDVAVFGPGDLWAQLARRCIVGISLLAGWGCRVDGTTVLVGPGEYAEFGHSGFQYALAAASPYPRGFSTALDGDTMQKLPQTVALLKDFERDFPVAYARLSAIPRREEDFDRILDACSGLEALLLSGEKDEVTFKFALRGAWVISSDAAERSVNIRRFRDVYAARSAIVHGSPGSQHRYLNRAHEIAKLAQDLFSEVALRALSPQWGSASAWHRYVEAAILG